LRVYHISGFYKMNYNQIIEKAEAMRIKAYEIEKLAIIRSIQRLDGHEECYGTQRLIMCKDFDCPWKMDCLSCYLNLLGFENTY